VKHGDKVNIVRGLYADLKGTFIGVSTHDPETVYVETDYDAKIGAFKAYQVRALRVGFVSLWDYKTAPGQVHAGTVYDTFQDALKEDRTPNGSHRVGVSKVEY
jgi:hypothetical protein